MPEDNKYGDFEEVIDENSVHPESSDYVPTRVRLPRDGQLIGIVVQRLGGNKMDVLCSDGKVRNSRVPGRYKRKMWLRPGHFVIVEKWEFDENKTDIIYQYRDPEKNQLKKKGLLDFANSGF
jgi:translation initiation factor 1A